MTVITMDGPFTAQVSIRTEQNVSVVDLSFIYWRIGCFWVALALRHRRDACASKTFRLNVGCDMCGALSVRGRRSVSTRVTLRVAVRRTKPAARPRTDRHYYSDQYPHRTEFRWDRFLLNVVNKSAALRRSLCLK
jgi:hypothetical protein